LGRGKGKRGVNKERGGDIVIVISSNRIRAFSQIQKQIEIKDIKNTHEEKINTSMHISILLTVDLKGLGHRMNIF
jgi:hypothetical protein